MKMNFELITYVTKYSEPKYR